MKKIVALSGIILTAAIFTACKKKYDTPPLKTVNEGASISINQLKARVPSNSSFYRFGSGDTNIYATVIGDEVSGNLYKQVFIRDEQNGAIQLNLTNAGGLRIGDKIRINLNNMLLTNVSSMIALDSVDIGKSVVKLSSGNPVTPTEVTIAQIQAGTVPSNTATSLQSQLVIIKDAEFLEKNMPFADAIGKGSINRALKQCNSSSTVTVRTSGYANFASKNTPTGNGTIIALVTQYNNTMQLTIRNYNEIVMNNLGCPILPPPPGTFMLKDFNDGSATSGGWSNQNVSGNINWTTAALGTWANKPYGNISNYVNAANVACESWLISPAVDLTSSTAPILNFMNAYNYTGPALTVWISTNYTSGLPSTASWTQLTFTASTGGFAFVNSGNISLNAYKTSNVRVAFKYTGTSTSGSTWEIDDVVIKEQ